MFVASAVEELPPFSFTPYSPEVSLNEQTKAEGVTNLASTSRAIITARLEPPIDTALVERVSTGQNTEVIFRKVIIQTDQALQVHVVRQHRISLWRET